MRYLILFVTLFIYSGLTSQCPPGDITLSSQAEVDDFSINYPGCSAIQGSLGISGADITNLDGLSGLNSVGGVLAIYNNAALIDVDGLNSLSSVGGLLIIVNNLLLESVAGLSGISSVGGFMNVGSNPSLLNIDGLSGVNSVGGGLFIDNNAALDEISDFCGLFTLLDGGGLTGSYDVNSNTVDPTQQQILDLGAACPPVKANAVPTIGEWGLVILSLLFLILGVVMIKKRAVVVV